MAKLVLKLVRTAGVGARMPEDFLCDSAFCGGGETSAVVMEVVFRWRSIEKPVKCVMGELPKPIYHNANRP